MYGCTVKVHEPVGVVAIACPDNYPLLAFVSLFAPAVVRGNTVIIVPSEKYPLSAADLYQVREVIVCCALFRVGNRCLTHRTCLEVLLTL